MALPHPLLHRSQFETVCFLRSQLVKLIKQYDPRSIVRAQIKQLEAIRHDDSIFIPDE